jgi:hypothetical protein
VAHWLQRCEGFIGSGDIEYVWGYGDVVCYKFRRYCMVAHYFKMYGGDVVAH